MTQPGFRESRGLSRRTFRNRRRRPGHPVAGKAGSFIEVAPPSMPGRDIGPEPGGGMILRLGRPVPGRPAGRRHPAASEAGGHAQIPRRAPCTGADPSRGESGMRAPARVPRSSPDHDQGARPRSGRLLHPGQAPGAGAVADRAHGAAGGSRLHRPAAAQAPCVATGGVTPHAGDIGGHRIVGKRPGPAPRCRLACPAVRMGARTDETVGRPDAGMGALHPAGGDEAVGDTRIPGTGPGSPDSRFFCPGLMPLPAPHPECIDQRAAPAAPRLETNARRLAVDPVLDGVDGCDQRQRPGGLAASPSPGGWRHGPRRRRCHR